MTGLPSRVVAGSSFNQGSPRSRRRWETASRSPSLAPTPVGSTFASPAPASVDFSTVPRAANVTAAHGFVRRQGGRSPRGPAAVFADPSLGGGWGSNTRAR